MRSASILYQECKIPCHVMCSYGVDPQFIGREDVLSNVHKALDPGSENASEPKVYTVVGLGGMGKTQIALSYSFHHQDIFPVILWADADGQSKLSESFILFARELGLGDLNSIQAKQAVKDCLQNLGNNASQKFLGLLNSNLVY